MLAGFVERMEWGGGERPSSVAKRIVGSLVVGWEAIVSYVELPPEY